MGMRIKKQHLALNDAEHEEAKSKNLILSHKTFVSFCDNAKFCPQQFFVFKDVFKSLHQDECLLK